MTRLLIFIAVLGHIGLVTATLCIAQEKAGEGLRGPFMAGKDPAARREFMHAAIDACTDHAAGDACTLSHDDKTIAGQCRQGPRDGMPLLCLPKFEPPQAAIDACANHADGAACSVTFRDHQFDGTCHSRPDGSGALACRPRPPAPSQAAIDACTDLSAEDECTIAIDGRDVQGHCRKGFSDNAPLACVARHMHRGFGMMHHADGASSDAPRGHSDDHPHHEQNSN